MEVDGCQLTGRFLRKGDFFLELLCYDPPAAIRPLPYRDDDLGWVHLSFLVADLAGTAAAVEAHGGAMRQNTQTPLDFGEGSPTTIGFCTDPDGNRIELVQHGDAAGQAAHGKFLGADALGWPPEAAWS